MRKMLFTGVSLFLVNFCFAQSQFALTIGGGSEDWGNSIIQTSDGGFAVVGVTFSFGAGSSDIFFAKFDATGTLEWARAIGGASWDKGYSLIQTSDGGFAVIGATYSFGAGEEDLLLLKLTPSGSLEWAYSIGGTNDDWGNSIIQTPDGKYIAFSGEYSGSRQVYVIPVNGGLPKQLTYYNDVADLGDFTITNYNGVSGLIEVFNEEIFPRSSPRADTYSRRYKSSVVKGDRQRKPGL